LGIPSADARVVGARGEIGLATMSYNIKRITNVLGATKLTHLHGLQFESFHSVRGKYHCAARKLVDAKSKLLNWMGSNTVPPCPCSSYLARRIIRGEPIPGGDDCI
jgi:hypothetical protein